MTTWSPASPASARRPRGFSFGVSRLVVALRQLGYAGGRGARGPRGPVVVIAFDEAGMADYFAAAAELRAAGIAARSTSAAPA